MLTSANGTKQDLVVYIRETWKRTTFGDSWVKQDSVFIIRSAFSSRQTNSERMRVYF